MITKENKDFLEKNLGINADKLSTVELNNLLDRIAEYLDTTIDAIDKKISELQAEIFNVENK